MHSSRTVRRAPTVCPATLTHQHGSVCGPGWWRLAWPVVACRCFSAGAVRSTVLGRLCGVCVRTDRG
eukprot:7054855-Prymnesium_polylepis.1